MEDSCIAPGSTRLWLPLILACHRGLNHLPSLACDRPASLTRQHLTKALGMLNDIMHVLGHLVLTDFDIFVPLAIQHVTKDILAVLHGCTWASPYYLDIDALGVFHVLISSKLPLERTPVYQWKQQQLNVLLICVRAAVQS